MFSHLINIADVELTDWGNGGRFEAKLGLIAADIGAKKLGYKLVIVPPGKTVWPYHFHYVNEEMFFIIEGCGTLRYDGAEYPIKTGDVISAPAGTDSAHQLINTSTEDLKYLAVSTMEDPDVFEYPDSNKYGVFVGSAPGGDKSLRRFSVFSRKQHSVDYWDGESE